MKKTYVLHKLLTEDKAVLTGARRRHIEGVGDQQREYFLASFADVPYSGPEVLVFPSTENGTVTEWSEVDGGRGYLNLHSFLAEFVSAPTCEEEE